MKTVLSAQLSLLVKKTIELALDSKFSNKQIYKKKYQMPSIRELVDNVVAQMIPLEKFGILIWIWKMHIPNLP